jgi:hypothetical protein
MATVSSKNNVYHLCLLLDSYVGLAAICEKVDMHPKDDYQKNKLVKTIHMHGIDYKRVNSDGTGAPRNAHAGRKRHHTYILEDHVESTLKLLMFYKTSSDSFATSRTCVLNAAVDGRQENERADSPELPHPATILRRPAGRLAEAPRPPATGSIQDFARASQVSSSFFESQEPEANSQDRASQGSTVAAPASQYRAGLSLSPRTPFGR